MVRLSCGAWYDPADGSEQALCPHGNANVLTRDQGTSKLGQGPSSATALVEVERWTEPLRAGRRLRSAAGCGGLPRSSLCPQFGIMPIGV